MYHLPRSTDDAQLITNIWSCIAAHGLRYEGGGQGIKDQGEGEGQGENPGMTDSTCSVLLEMHIAHDLSRATARGPLRRLRGWYY